MKKAWLTEDSFWQPSDWYMKFLVMPDVEKEVLSWEIIYKISIDANDNKVYYYEISWSEWKITRSTITEDFTIDKKSWTNNNLTYTISPEDKKSSKRTIDLNELWIDDIYEYEYLKKKGPRLKIGLRVHLSSLYEPEVPDDRFGLMPEEIEYIFT